MKKEKSELSKVKAENKKLKEIIKVQSDMNRQLTKIVNFQAKRLELIQEGLKMLTGSTK